MPSHVVSVRLDEKIYRRLKEVARAENRSLSNFIENATMHYLNDLSVKQGDVSKFAGIWQDKRFSAAELRGRAWKK